MLFRFRNYFLYPRLSKKPQRYCNCLCLSVCYAILQNCWTKLYLICWLTCLHMCVVQEHIFKGSKAWGFGMVCNQLVCYTPPLYKEWGSGIMLYPPLKIALSVSNIRPSIRHPSLSFSLRHPRHFAFYLELFLTVFFIVV